MTTKKPTGRPGEYTSWFMDRFGMMTKDPNPNTAYQAALPSCKIIQYRTDDASQNLPKEIGGRIDYAKGFIFSSSIYSCYRI